jgi:hypothetical protein
MIILAVINVLVIIQGFISCKHKLGLHPKKISDIVTFYMIAFMSLGTAIVYCLSEFIIKTEESPKCAYILIESLPAILYLLSAYAYMAQSISSLML